jgi:dynein light intermediate chain 1
MTGQIFGMMQTKVRIACDFECQHIRALSSDTLARLSVYEVPSSASSYTALLPHSVPPKTALPHTVAIIVLDWTRPWTFLDELETWLLWIDKWTTGDTSREAEIVREETRERCMFLDAGFSFQGILTFVSVQSYIQRYTEPSSEPLPANTSLNETLLPLAPGILTHNTSGIPIIVVCTKADLIDDSSDAAGGGMVKGKSDEWEERTDGIMQVLRTVCLKCRLLLRY